MVLHDRNSKDSCKFFFVLMVLVKHPEKENLALSFNHLHNRLFELIEFEFVQLFR